MTQTIGSVERNCCALPTFKKNYSDYEKTLADFMRYAVCSVC